MIKLLVCMAFCLLFGQLVTASSSLDYSDKLKKLKEVIAYYKNITSVGHEAPLAAESEKNRKILNPYVMSTFSTIEVFTLQQDETIMFETPMCGQYVNWAVNATILLNNNPGWDPEKGIVEYSIETIKEYPFEESIVLCTNVDATGKASAHCLIAARPNNRDMRITITAGPVSGVSFTLNVNLYPQNSEGAYYIAPRVPADQKLIRNPLTTTTESHYNYLAQSVSVLPSPSTQLTHMQEGIMTHWMCAPYGYFYNSQTESVVMSIDGESSYTQYICGSVFCEVGGDNIVAHNGNQLSTNVVFLDRGILEYTFLIVNWGGAYDPEINDFVGSFVFRATHVLCCKHEYYSSCDGDYAPGIWCDN